MGVGTRDKPNGRLSWITTPEGVVTAYSYDPATGDRLSVDAGGAVTQYGYNGAGQVTAIIGAAGDATRPPTRTTGPGCAR